MLKTCWRIRRSKSPKEKDQFGLVFAKWGGWKYEGDCEFRVGQVGHSGKLLVSALRAASGPRFASLRMSRSNRAGIALRPTCAGSTSRPGRTTQSTEFMFDGKYIQARTSDGTFGWTKLTYVGEIKEKKEAGPSFGLFAPGYFWIDDVIARAGGCERLPSRQAPVLGREENADRAAG